MKLANLFRRRDPAANLLYGALVAQARRPEFYLACGVPDTVQGRFEMIALHMFVVLHRLKRERKAATDLAQDMFDIMFLDMDRNLRELGTGDLAVGKRIKALAKGFYGRIAAYERGLTQDVGPGADSLEEALVRNVFPDGRPAAASLAALSDYLRRSAEILSGQAYDDIAAGLVVFAAPPVAHYEVPPSGSPSTELS